MGRPKTDPVLRFRASYRVGLNGCWVWVGRLDADGYAAFYPGTYYAGDRRRPRVVRAARWSYAKFKGPIPMAMLVRHRCDNRACVNPEHLFLGTQRQNMADMRQRGRSGGPGKGEAHPNARVTEATAREVHRLRAQGQSWAAIGRVLGLSQTHARKIGTGKLWRHVKGDVA